MVESDVRDRPTISSGTAGPARSHRSVRIPVERGSLCVFAPSRLCVVFSRDGPDSCGEPVAAAAAGPASAAAAAAGAATAISTTRERRVPDHHQPWWRGLPARAKANRLRSNGPTTGRMPTAPWAAAAGAATGSAAGAATGTGAGSANRDSSSGGVSRQRRAPIRTRSPVAVSATDETVSASPGTNADVRRLSGWEDRQHRHPDHLSHSGPRLHHGRVHRRLHSVVADHALRPAGGGLLFEGVGKVPRVVGKPPLVRSTAEGVGGARRDLLDGEALLRGRPARLGRHHDPSSGPRVGSRFTRGGRDDHHLDRQPPVASPSQLTASIASDLLGDPRH
jgi:hypothetical protein